MLAPVIDWGLSVRIRGRSIMGSNVVMVELPGCAAPKAFDYAKQQRSSKEKLLEALKEHDYALDAGRHGTVELWKDDSGAYQCQFTCYCLVDPDSKHTGDFDAAKEWLDTWWEKQHDFA